MGKVRTRIIGLEDVETKQKKEQKQKAKTRQQEKKVEEEKVVAPVQEEKVEKKVKKAKARVRGKKYQVAKRQVDKTKTYSLTEALTLLRKIKWVKFDESVELHINTHKDGLKGEVQMPHSIGKQVRVKIVDDKLLGEIEGGKIDFDILVTHPSNMARLAKYAKILGPRGLMPSPKSGTISEKPEDVVKRFSQGALRWKTEVKFPLVHQLIGKVSLDDKELVDNVRAFVKAVGKNNIKELWIKTTMTPSVKLNLESI
jgi:large subunit ribosomal protein L1